MQKICFAFLIPLGCVLSPLCWAHPQVGTICLQMEAESENLDLFDDVLPAFLALDDKSSPSPIVFEKLSPGSYASKGGAHLQINFGKEEMSLTIPTMFEVTTPYSARLGSGRPNPISSKFLTQATGQNYLCFDGQVQSLSGKAP